MSMSVYPYSIPIGRGDKIKVLYTLAVGANNGNG